MCRKFILASNIIKIKNRFNLDPNGESIEINKSYSVSGKDITLVITSENPHELTAMQFGFTPHWAKNKMDLLNARAEGDKNLNNNPNYSGPNAIFLKPEFRKAIQTQRCLVIADAWYDWANNETTFLFYLCNKDRPFAFAGIYDYWKNPNTNKISCSFSIITTTANSIVRKAGIMRMPVILSKSDEQKWLKPEQPLAYYLKRIKQISSELINGYQISSDLLNSGINSSDLLIQHGPKLQEEVIVKALPKKHIPHKVKPTTQNSWGENRKNQA